jgi:hypothetical protein
VEAEAIEFAWECRPEYPRIPEPVEDLSREFARLIQLGAKRDDGLATYLMGEFEKLLFFLRERKVHKAV